MYILSPLKANIGNMRETFFANQLKKSHQVTTLDLHPSITDKIERIPDGFIVADDIKIRSRYG